MARGGVRSDKLESFCSLPSLCARRSAIDGQRESSFNGASLDTIDFADYVLTCDRAGKDESKDRVVGKMQPGAPGARRNLFTGGTKASS